MTECKKSVLSVDWLLTSPEMGFVPNFLIHGTMLLKHMAERKHLNIKLLYFLLALASDSESMLGSALPLQSCLH